MKLAKVNIGDVVQIKSDEWYIWTGDCWREMTVEEQEAFT